MIKCYADLHDVDEDLRTIPLHDGYWEDGNTAGVMKREMKYISTGTFNSVASSNTGIDHSLDG